MDTSREGQLVRFDAQCDIAAVVFRAGDNPDRLISDFADELSRSGLRPVGLIQSGHCQSQQTGLNVVILPDRESVNVTSDSTPLGAGCRFDAGRFAEVTGRLARSIEAGADLLIVNRFGHLEAEGEGLAGLIEQAFNADIPVLIAVSVKRFPDWVRFCHGMNVRLRCDLEELHRWWHSIAPGSNFRGRSRVSEQALR